ncbi:MAG: tetratricopeptide repeat protein [Candidatus Omnitrophica bacterium]|nr:tetratricopeptide repeat protein [Candidatus Omnitrophota bacterium]
MKRQNVGNTMYIMSGHKIISVLLVAAFFIFGFWPALDPCFALDWKRLHEEADRKNLPEALLAAEKHPGSIAELYMLGLVYLNLHKDKEAEDIFNRIIKSGPATVEARWGLAESLRRQHQPEKSEIILKEVMRLDPGFSPAYISMAYLKYINMDFNGTVRLALKVIQQGRGDVDLSNYVRAYTLYAGAKGMIAHYGGPVSKVINGMAILRNLKKAEELQPDSTAVNFGLGTFYLLAPPLAGGNLDKAEEYLKKAVTLDPLFVDACIRLAQIYKIKGDDKQYDYYIEKASEIDPKNVLLIDTLSGKCKFICVGRER